MENSKEDRRIRRTRRLLKESLVDLMSEKAFNDITIKDITERADLNRGTFYLHYADTYSLLKAMETDVLDDFQDMISNYDALGPETGLMPILLPVISYIVENEEICKNLFENNFSNDFHKAFKNLLQRNGRVILERVFPVCKQAPSDYFFEFITYGLIGTLRKWLDDGLPESEKQIAKMVNDSVMALAYAFFGTKG